MALDDRRKASFDAAGEAVKQLTTLGTGSIGGIIALFDDGAKAGIDLGTGSAIYLALGLLALSVVCGVFALGALAGQLGSPAIRRPSTYAFAVLFMSRAQMACFGPAILLSAAAVIFRI